MMNGFNEEAAMQVETNRAGGFLISMGIVAGLTLAIVVLTAALAGAA